MNCVSDLASSNNVATNGVNGGIDNKTWWKYECCAPMETSIEGACCLEIPETCKPRFSSTSRLKVCRSIHILCYDILGEKTLLVI